MRTATLLALLLAAPALAGCIGTDGEDAIDPTNASVPSTADLEDVQAALEAGNESANLDVLGHWRESGAQEVDPWGEFLFVSRGDRVAILDVSDPQNPTETATITDLPASLDVKVSDDGRFLFVGDDQEASGDPQGGTGPLTGGIYVYDVRDKSDPQRVHYEPVGNSRGPHMVYYHNRTDGAEYVYAAAGKEVVIHKWIRSEQVLQETGRYEPGQLEQNRDPNALGALYNPQAWLHDMNVETTPDGRELMYVAAWDAGLHVVDVSEPSSPERLGTWNDFSDDESGNLHTVATSWIGDRRITIGAVEIGFLVVGGQHWVTDSEKSVLYVWDTTDPESPELLGKWTNPVDSTSGRNAFVAGEMPGEELTSTHNVQLVNGRAYVAHYGLGVWVVDLSTEANQTDPSAIAYHHTDEMSTWDVVLNDGVVYTSGDVGVKGLSFPLEPIGPNGTTTQV